MPTLTKRPSAATVLRQTELLAGWVRDRSHGMTGEPRTDPSGRTCNTAQVTLDQLSRQWTGLDAATSAPVRDRVRYRQLTDYLGATLAVRSAGGPAQAEPAYPRPQAEDAPPMAPG